MILGRRDIDESGQAAWQLKDGHRVPLYTKFSLTKNGITTFSDVPLLAKITLVSAHCTAASASLQGRFAHAHLSVALSRFQASCATYLFIQIPALVYMKDADRGAKNIHNWALVSTLALLFSSFPSPPLDAVRFVAYPRFAMV